MISVDGRGVVQQDAGEARLGPQAQARDPEGEAVASNKGLEDPIQSWIDALGARVQNSSDKWEKAIIYLEISRLFIKKQDFDCAITMATCIEDVSRQSMALQEIANALMKLDRHPHYKPLNKAFEAVSQMANKDRKDRAFIGLFEESIRRGDLNLAGQICLGTKDEQKNDWMRRQVLKKSVSVYGLDPFLKAISSTGVKKDRDEALDFTFDYFSDIRDCESALTVIDKMGDDKKTESIASLARVLTEDSRLEDASKVLAKLTDPQTKDNLCIEMAEVWIEANQKELGFDWKKQEEGLASE